MNMAGYGSYYLEQCGKTALVIRHRVSGRRYDAGKDIGLAWGLVARLNKAHRPGIEQMEGGLYVCWNLHEKGDDCDYVKEIDYNKNKTLPGSGGS